MRLALVIERDGLATIFSAYFTQSRRKGFYGWRVVFRPAPRAAEQRTAADLFRRPDPDVALGAHVAPIDYTFTPQQFPRRIAAGRSSRSPLVEPITAVAQCVFVPFKYCGRRTAKVS